MDNPLETLLGETPASEEEHVEAQEDVADAAPEPTPEPEPPATAPISALMDERDKRQAAERKARELEARFAAQARDQAEPPPLEEQVEQRLYQANLRASRRFAEREYGKDLIGTVHDWAAARCDADPLFNQQMRSSEDPYESAMQAYNHEQIVAKVTPDRLAAFEAWEAAQAAQQAQTPMHPPHNPAAAAAPLPRSLATAPGNGSAGASAINMGPGAAFEAAIRS